MLGAFLYESYDIKAPRTLKKNNGKCFSLYGAYPRQGGYEFHEAQLRQIKEQGKDLEEVTGDKEKETGLWTESMQLRFSKSFYLDRTRGPPEALPPGPDLHRQGEPKEGRFVIGQGHQTGGHAICFLLGRESLPHQFRRKLREGHPEKSFVFTSNGQCEIRSDLGPGKSGRAEQSMQ